MRQLFSRLPFTVIFFVMLVTTILTSGCATTGFNIDRSPTCNPPLFVVVEEGAFTDDAITAIQDSIKAWNSATDMQLLLWGGVVSHADRDYEAADFLAIFPTSEDLNGAVARARSLVARFPAVDGAPPRICGVKSHILVDQNYIDTDVARMTTIFTHELGHVLGYRSHNYDGAGVMEPSLMAPGSWHPVEISDTEAEIVRGLYR